MDSFFFLAIKFYFLFFLFTFSGRSLMVIFSKSFLNFLRYKLQQHTHQPIYHPVRGRRGHTPACTQLPHLFTSSGRVSAASAFNSASGRLFQSTERACKAEPEVSTTCMCTSHKRHGIEPYHPLSGTRRHCGVCWFGQLSGNSDMRSCHGILSSA